jgi:hypothetical protein
MTLVSFVVIHMVLLRPSAVHRGRGLDAAVSGPICCHIGQVSFVMAMTDRGKGM